jgi:hypothetical protein
MRRALVRGWWALPIAAGLTLVVPAPAQPPGAAGPPTPARPVIGGPGDADPNRLAEIQVGLAWLADPMTFPYHLAARARAGNLEIRGFVPNEATRARAVKVAREHCELNVVDSLRIHAVSIPTTVKPPQELHAAVLACLKANFPRQAGTISVLCRPHGQVVITGRVTSLEERLAVSQEMRRVPGCTSVVNRLAAVAPRPPAQPVQAARPAQPVPASNFGVATQPLTFTRIPPQAARVDGDRADQGPALPPPAASPYGQSASPAVAGLPNRPTMPEVKMASAPGMSPSPYGATAPGLPRPPLQQMPAPGAAPASGSPYAASAPAQAKPLTFATASRAPAPPALPPLAVTPPFGDISPSPLAAQASPQKLATASPAPSLPAPEKPAAPPSQPSQWTRAPVAPAGGLSLPPPPVQTPAGVWTAGPASAVVQTSFRPEDVRPAPGPAPRQTALASPAVVPQPSPTTSRPTWAPATTPRPSLPPPGEPYVTRGFVIVADAGPEPVRPQALMPTGDPWVRRQAQLKQAIQTACGPAVRDVEVEVYSSTEAQVRFRAASKAEADRLWAQIQRLPDLSPYKKLDVVVKAPDAR